MLNQKITKFVHRPSQSNLMYLLILGIWLVSMIGLVASAYNIFLTLDSILSRLLWAFIAFSSSVFWYYALYHYALVIFRYLSKIRKIEKKYQVFPSAAILYNVVDDFRYDAALSCVKQDYPNFHVFLIDASRTQQGTNEVKKFHYSFPQTTTIIRQASRSGFKARGVNLALSGKAHKYDFFGLCDSDGLLPRDFLKQIIPYFQKYKKLGFVQANHNSDSSVKNSFTKHFLAETKIRWQYNNVPRNRYGFPLCLGHGVVINMEAWARVGGFPEVVAEDVAFTIALRNKGYWGLFVEEVVCSEAFPESLKQIRKQHYRRVIADTETFLLYTLPFLNRPIGAFAEKMDILSHTLRRTASSLFLPYILSLLILSLAVGNDFINTSLAGNGLVSLGVVIIGWLAVVSPLARVVIQMYRKPIKMFRHLSQVTSVYLSFCLHSTVGILNFILTRKAHFFVTGAKGKRKKQSQGFLESLARLDPNNKVMITTPLVLAIFLAGGAIYTLNIALLGIALAMVSPVLQSQFHWKRKSAEVTAWSSLLLIFSGIILGPLGLIGPSWQCLVPIGFSVLIRT